MGQRRVHGDKHGGSDSDHKTPLHLHHTTTNTMSDAEVKNDVAAEAPTAEELKAQKRSAEDDEVDHKKQKTENGSNGATAEDEGEEEEDAEEEEDIDGEEEEDVDGEGEEDLDEEEGGEGHYWSHPGNLHGYANDEEGEEEEGEGEEDEGE